MVRRTIDDLVIRDEETLKRLLRESGKQWCVIAGSRETNKAMERDSKKFTENLIRRGYGLIIGGACGVDQFATQQAIDMDKVEESVYLILPSEILDVCENNTYRISDGRISRINAESHTKQLVWLLKNHPSNLYENSELTLSDKTCPEERFEIYKRRNRFQAEIGDELVAFHADDSPGTKDIIGRFNGLGKPVHIVRYEIDKPGWTKGVKRISYNVGTEVEAN